MTRKTLIIGGASGIGFAVGSLLAGRGEEIILAGRDGAKLDEMLGYMDKFEFWFNIVTP